MSSNNKTYCGDGLYAQDDGYMVTLSCDRENGEHYVCLESSVLQEFIAFLEGSRNLKFKIEPGPAKTTPKHSRLCGQVNGTWHCERDCPEYVPIRTTMQKLEKNA